ncbi:MAG: hypothetical protein HY241_12525 [Actinobacteria bacterium]|nr:hypothetical protein [Actinomycetota bacterium]
MRIVSDDSAGATTDARPARSGGVAEGSGWWSDDGTRQELMLESAQRREIILCRVRYAVATLAVVMSALFHPHWVVVAGSLLLVPVGVHLLVRAAIRRLRTVAEADRLGHRVLAADIAVATVTYLIFLSDPDAIPAVFVPLVVFELAVRFDLRYAVVGVAIFGVTVAIRVYYQIRVIPEGALRQPLLLVWILLVGLVLMLARELRAQDRLRLAAREERERIATNFRDVVGEVLARSGVPPHAASWAEVLDAVQRVCDDRSGERVSLAASIADLLVPAAREFGLTRREGEIIRLLAQDYSYDRIARALAVSGSTVRNHVHHVRGKLGVSSREEIVAFARAQGLVPS